jgi:hypothetical protein
VEYLVVALMAAAVAAVAYGGGRAAAGRLLPLLLGAYAVRLFVHVFVYRAGLIAYGGDNHTYESAAEVITAYWRLEGFKFVTRDDIPGRGIVAVPCNLYAAVQYLCGGRATLGCTAVVAMIACALCMVIYRFAKLCGADERAAYRLCALTAFGPSFVLHTSDLFKDGINAFLTVTALWVAVSNARRFDVRKLAALVPLLWAQWYVRPYMVFMCALPVLLGLVGLRRALSPRGALVVLGLLVAGLVATEGGSDTAALDAAQQQLDRGLSPEVLADNAIGGSGVTFDDGGSPWGALGPKLLYTLLAPFPWMGGSVGLQLGKLETLLWYYLLYSALRGVRWFWRHDRETLLLLGLFVVPATVIYAMTMTNVGLIFRQRMPIVMVTSVLSAVVWTKLPRRAARPAALPATAARRA